MAEVKEEAKERINLRVTFKVKFMATSNINKVSVHNKKTMLDVASAFKKSCSIERFYRQCSGTAIILTLFYL